MQMDICLIIQDEFGMKQILTITLAGAMGTEFIGLTTV